MINVEEMGGLEKMYVRRRHGRLEVAEVFSPPQICAGARERGKQGVWSSNWITRDPVTGEFGNKRLLHDSVSIEVLESTSIEKPDTQFSTKNSNDFYDVLGRRNSLYINQKNYIMIPRRLEHQ